MSGDGKPLAQDYVIRLVEVFLQYEHFKLPHIIPPQFPSASSAFFSFFHLNSAITPQHAGGSATILLGKTQRQQWSCGPLPEDAEELIKTTVRSRSYRAVLLLIRNPVYLKE
jgi:hypothetical protein